MGTRVPASKLETNRMIHQHPEGSLSFSETTHFKITLLSQRHASHGSCRLIPSLEPERVVSEANDFFWFQDETSRPMKTCWMRTLLRTVMLRMVPPLIDLLRT
jgi:hypothetical protein